MDDQLVFDFDQPREEWRSIEGWPDYAVSSLGRVRRATPFVQRNPRRPDVLMVRRPANSLLKQKTTSTGYLSVKLFADGKSRQIGVHILVCRAFHGAPPSPRHEAAHGDGCPTNNVESNLRWATRRENAQDMVMHGRSQRGIRNPRQKLTPDQAAEIRRLREQGHSLKVLAQQFGISVAQVSVISRGINWGWVPPHT